MAETTNGRATEPGQKGLNGHAMNGHAKGAKPFKASRSAAPKRSIGWRFMSTVARLFTWFSILSILFRCPQTADLVTSESPRICKPYFQVRSIVAPHLEPYYNTYAAPYVDSARPYYEVVNSKLITPATAIAKKYGAPRVAQAQAFGNAQWEKNFAPEVQKYQKLAQVHYARSLAPHVNTAVATASPYYELAKTNALQTYYDVILPTYTTVEPYAIQGYNFASDFTVNTAYPLAAWAWTTGGVFLDRTVLPQARILYGENVEPQLVRIKQRLGRYKDGQKIKAVIEDYDSTSSAKSASKSVSSIASSVASAHSTPAPISTSTETTTPGPSAIPEKEKEVRQEAQKVVANDLKEWQEKFAKAADEGSEDLDERITEITNRMVNSQAEKVGKSHLIQLEDTVKSSIADLKSSIISIVKSGSHSEERENEINAAVRKAGRAILEKAQEVRTWGQSYDMETNTLVSKAASDTLEVLDLIRDSGLQEIGMRWAWTDGVTHKDWKKYHQLKGKFDEWRFDVEKVATQHPGLEKARSASQEVINQALHFAQETAKELSRLKETGLWKLTAGDTSDDWSTKYMPAAAAGISKKVKDMASDASEQIMPTSQGTIESVVSVASSSAESLASVVSSSISDTASQASSVASQQIQSAKSLVNPSSQGSIESVASVVKESLSSVAEHASSSVIGTSTGSVESIASIVKASAGSIADQASSSIIGTSQGTVESIASVASESVSSLSAKASSSVIGTQPGVAEKATSSARSVGSVISDSASSSLSSASSVLSSVASDLPSSVGSAAAALKSASNKKVFAGAMAQHVEARQIVFEDIVEDSDDETFSERLQSMASQAGDRYSDITKAVSEALLKTSSADRPAITKMAADQYASALSAASIALYGTEQGTGESISSVVSSKYLDAVAAASAIIYGTPIPMTDSIASKASSLVYGTPTPIAESIAAQATGVYLAAMAQASEQYAKAKSIVSAQISGEPKPIHQEMYSSVESAYSDSMAGASSRLSSALSVASTAMYGTPTPAFQSVLSSLSSVADSRLSEGLSAATSRWEASKSYVEAMRTEAPRKQQLLNQMQGQYYAGIGMAHARYSEFMQAASSAILPRETPFHESVYSKASAGLVGTTTNKYQAALNTAEAYYSSAINGASSQLDDLIASVGSAAGGQKDYASSIAAMASSKYNEAVSSASTSYLSIQSVISSKLAVAMSDASTVVIGSETPWTESVASAASDNWEALITKASEQIYGAPTPYMVTRRLLSEVSEYAAQATDAASSQYMVVQSIVSELVIGRDPDFTESVYNRLGSAYSGLYTGAGQAVSSASSLASEAYESASSVVASVFTPPPQLESALTSAQSALESLQNAASEQIYGTSTGYFEAAQSSISLAAELAQKSISEAVYGTPTGTFESITSVAGEVYASATAAVSSAIYGEEEKSAVESANARLFAAVESARGKLAEYAAQAQVGAQEAVKIAGEAVEGVKETVSAAAYGEEKGHDEL